MDVSATTLLVTFTALAVTAFYFLQRHFRAKNRYPAPILASSLLLPPNTSNTNNVKESAQSQLRQSMRDFGFCVLRIDKEDYLRVWNAMRSTAEAFFTQEAEYKLKYSTSQLCSGGAAADPLVQRLKQRDNRGYKIVPDMKEYIKLRYGDDNECWPDQPADFKEKYSALWEVFRDISFECLKVLATHETESKERVMDAQTVSVIERFMNKRSSLSVIRYFATKAAEQRNEPTELSANSQLPTARPLIDENGNRLLEMSANHIDTGLVTVISCTNVPGLQVLDKSRSDRNNGAEHWITPECIYQPTDICIVLGRKFKVLSNEKAKDTFQPLLHRVVLPENTERYSIVFMLDVP